MQGRLHGRRQLDDGVDRGHAVELGGAEAGLGRAHHADARVVRVHTLVAEVDDQDGEGALRVRGDERVGERRRHRQVVARDDRAAVDHVTTSRCGVVARAPRTVDSGTSTGRIAAPLRSGVERRQDADLAAGATGHARGDRAHARAAQGGGEGREPAVGAAPRRSSRAGPPARRPRRPPAARTRRRRAGCRCAPCECPRPGRRAVAPVPSLESSSMTIASTASMAAQVATADASSRCRPSTSSRQ